MKNDDNKIFWVAAGGVSFVSPLIALLSAPLALKIHFQIFLFLFQIEMFTIGHYCTILDKSRDYYGTLKLLRNNPWCPGFYERDFVDYVTGHCPQLCEGRL